MNICLNRGGRVLASFFLTIAALVTTVDAANDKGKGNDKKNDVTTYSGRAIALRIDGVTHPVSGPIIVADTGELPTAGGFLQRTATNVNVGSGALTIGHADAQASGDGPEAAAQSTLTDYRAEFVVQDGDHTHRAVIEADFIHAEASAVSDKKGTVGVSSRVLIEGLKVNGKAIPVTGAPNQRVDLPHEVGGYLVINEITTAAAGTGDGDIAVTAIRFHVCHCIDGHIGKIYAGITTTGNPPPPSGDGCGKVTGGGWISTASGAKGTFGVSGGIRRGAYWGHLTYQDHGTGMKVQSTAVTGFEETGPTSRVIRYAVTINGAPGTATVRVVDNGEPGRNDIFEITLSTGYTAGGSLGGSRPGGGNIQVHKCPAGW